ncbi:MAG: SNF2-related protein, partial [Candidatus Hydrogenedentales bacterium]
MKTFGTIKYVKGQWRINAAPHVALRLKRVFPKVKKGTVGEVRIVDTPEICRELEWFMQRYPLEIDTESKARLLGQSSKHREKETLIEELLAGIQPARAFNLSIPPRDYQRVAAEVCLTSGGLLLADDVGIGKTCVGICMLADPHTLPALVVTLTHLPRQWEGEIRRFAPHLRTHILKTGTPYDLRGKNGASHAKQLALPEMSDMPDVIITNYHK